MPRDFAGASSSSPAAPIVSANPAPTPVNAEPPMATSIRCAVPTTIKPMQTRPDASRAAYRRPMRSEREPAIGETAATARVFATPSHASELAPPISATV